LKRALQSLLWIVVMAGSPAVSAKEQATYPWPKEVVYQIYPRSFADGNGDGIGDLRGIISRVDYLKELGIDVVWLCPVNRTTNYDNGYDVTDYLDIDSTFGTLADWDALRDALHARGIKIMMDLVLNHTSDAHPWFLQEVRLKNLRQQLTPTPPRHLHMSQALFAEAMRALLLDKPLPPNVAGDVEPFASAAIAIADLRKSTERATSLGYLTAAEQLDFTARLLYGTAKQREQAARENHDFYIWRDTPNNWTSIFSGSAWHYVQSTGAYYMALFSLHQPDLNWHNERFRQTMYDVVQTWVKRGVNGFRLDSVAFIAKDQRFLDAPASDTARMGRGLQYFVNQPQVHDYMRELKQYALRHMPVRTAGEVTFSPVEVALEYAGADREELTEVFLFDHMYVDIKNDKWNAIPLRLREFKRVLGRQQSVLHGRAWVANYLENHDQLRAVSRFGDDRNFRVQSAVLLGTLLMTLEGTPYIYQGQEIGMTNGHFSRIEEVDDIEARNYYSAAIHAGESPIKVMANVAARNRDNVRTVMQWNDTAYAGFSSHQPWTKVNANYVSINVAQAQQDPHSVLAYYKKLIALRKEHQVVVSGQYHDLLPMDDQLYVYTRELNSEKVLVTLNFSGDTKAVPIALSSVMKEVPRLLFDNYEGTPVPTKNSGISLRPWEARIYANF
jgi:oligo-1,6-glucosidase